MSCRIATKRCRRIGTHNPHVYEYKDTEFHCPGEVHDHEKYCCKEHDFHHMPHNGCILR